MLADYELRPYQKEASDFVLQCKLNKKQSALVVLPTGCGKTIIISSVIEKEIESGGRVLILAHRNTLLEQVGDKLKKSSNIEVTYEGKKVRAENVKESKVVVCSIQTLSKEDRIREHKNDEFSMIVIDEVHHIGSPSYQKIVSFFSKAFVFGVTATPNRSDGEDTRDYFEEVWENYSRNDAIRDGYLCPVKVKQIPITINVSKVHLSGGDYAPGELSEILKKYIEKIAKSIVNCVPNRKTIVFTPTVEIAKQLSETLNSIGFSSDYVSGERKDSFMVLEQFRKDKIRVLTNACLLTEGYDEPSVDCVINLRITRSETMYTQIIGRGLRICPGKENALIIDFLWKDGGRGHLRPADILINEPDIFVREAMDKVLSNGLEMDIDMLHEEAKILGEKLKEEKLESLRQASLAQEENRINKIKQSEEIKKQLYQYGISRAANTGEPFESICGVVSPNEKVKILMRCKTGEIVKVKVFDKIFEMLGVDKYEPSFSWEHNPATQSQIYNLSNIGIDEKYITCTGHASYLLDFFYGRQKNGMASYKQLKMLMRYKVENFSTYSQKEAKIVIDTIAKNGWKYVSVDRC